MSNDTDANGLGSEATPGNNLVGDGNDLELADPNDIFFAQRDSDGKPSPVKQRVPGREEAVLTRPPTEGFYNQYLDPVPSEDNEQVAAMLNEGFPQLDVDASDVGNGLLIYSLETMVEMLKRAGGYDMYSALQEQQEEQNMKQVETMMQAMGVSGGEDMSPADFLEALGDMDMNDVEEAAEDNAAEEGEVVGGPARPNGEQ